MSYYKVLRTAIAESGYTSKQIIDELNTRGKKLDKAYLSRLLNNKAPAPSEDLSRLISNICNVDERKLVLEGYLDKAPKEIKEALLSMKAMTYMMTTKIYDNMLEENFFENMKEKLQEEPLSDFLISFIDEQADIMNSLENGMELLKESDDIFKLKLEEPLSLKVCDNGMFPKIAENSKINLILQNKYDDFDILAVKLKNNDDIIVRFVTIKENEILLKPLNNQFETLKCKPEDITILGKVTKIITDI